MSSLTDKRYLDGSIVKSSDDWDPGHYDDLRIYYPVMGVVLAVYPSDHPKNMSVRDNSLLRGFQWEADVAVVMGASEGQTVIPNVAIAPQGPSGIGNFTQDIPRPSSFLVDGSVYKGSLEGVDLDKLDGDRCLIQFIGGKSTQPVMTSWMPHPANVQDPSTDAFSPGSLKQGSPSLMRRQGTTVSVTQEGSIFIDTNGANEEILPTSAGYTKVRSAIGGDIQVDMKPSKAFAIDFNESISRSGREPSLLQDNPPLSDTAPIDREDTNTSFFMDAEALIATAGRLMKLATRDGPVVLTPSTKLFLGDETSNENMVLGQEWKTMTLALMEVIVALMEAFKTHTHPTGTGPSGPPLTPELVDVSTLITGDMQTLMDEIDDVLSDYIFGSKVVPDPPDLILADREEETGEDA